MTILTLLFLALLSLLCWVAAHAYAIEHNKPCVLEAATVLVCIVCALVAWKAIDGGVLW